MVHSAFTEQSAVHAVRVQNKSWLCLYISFWPLPMETKQNEFGQNTPNGTNPLMSPMNTLALVHTDLRKQTWSTLFQIKMTYKLNKHPKQKHVDFEEVAQHALCVLPLCASTVCLWQRHQMDFDPISFDTDSTTNRSVTLLTHQLAAMEQLGNWQYSSSIFFSFYYKTSGKVWGKFRLDGEPLCFGTFTKKTTKNNTTKDSRREEKLVSLCLCVELNARGAFPPGRQCP